MRNKQTAPAAASPDATDAKQLYLVVHDKRDVPIVDLKPEDLAMTEDGSPVKLNNLQLVDQRQKAKQLVTFVFDPFLSDKDEKPQKLTSRIATARDAALKILSMLNESGFEFSVFTVDSRLHLQQGFTSNLNAIEAAIHTATVPLASRDKDHAAATEKEIVSVALSGADTAGKRVPANDRLLARSIYAAIKNSTRIAQDRHISPSFSSILALVQSQQDLDGRKTVIYLSSLRQEQIDATAKKAIDSIVGSANQAGVGINVVDGAALGHHGRSVQAMDMTSQSAAVSLSQGSNTASPGSTASYGSGEGTLEVVDDPPIDEDLQHLAEGTGGTYFNGDGLKAIHQLIGDMTTYYEASFLPTSGEFDGKLHPLAVKTLRAGLRIRTQTGYLSLPPTSADGSSLEPFELPLLKLLKESPLPSQFSFRAAVLDMGDSDEGRRTALAVDVPAEELNLQKDANSPSSACASCDDCRSEGRDRCGCRALQFRHAAEGYLPFGRPLRGRTSSRSSATLFCLQENTISKSWLSKPPVARPRRSGFHSR